MFRQKWPKPLAPRPASSDGRTQAYGGRANSLRSDKARRLMRTSAHGARRQASVMGKGGMDALEGMLGRQATLAQNPKNVTEYGILLPEIIFSCSTP
jgi:hypothetical protein